MPRRPGTALEAPPDRPGAHRRHGIFLGRPHGARYGERLREAGADIAVATFAGAHHGFDNPGSGLTRIAGYPTAARCNLREVSRGTIVNIDTGKPLDGSDSCFGQGLVAGRDEAADTATKAAVRRS